MAETPIDSPPGMKITEENKLKGSLFIEAFGGMIDSISKDAESETEKALDITFNTIGAVASAVMFAIDPLGSLIGAGIGWLIEHVSFLRDALNVVMGNPEEIQANVEATKAKAVELRTLAEDHRKGLATFDGWTGRSSEAYKASMDQLGQELDTLANAVETKAKIVAITGMLVTVLRDIIRDLISQLLGSLIAGALIAAATAWITFGASVVAYIGFAVGKAVALGTNIAARIARVVASMSRLTGKIGNLDEVTAKVSKGWDRFENAADVAEISYEGYKASDGVDDAVDEARGGGGGGAGGGAGGGGNSGSTTTAASARQLSEAPVEALQPARMGTRVEAPQMTGTYTEAPRMMMAAERTEALQPMKVGERREALQPMKVGEQVGELRPRMVSGQMVSGQVEELQPARMGTRMEAPQMMTATHVEAPRAMMAAERTEALQPTLLGTRVEAPHAMMAAERVEAPQQVVTGTRVEAPQAVVAGERVEAAEAAVKYARDVNAGTSVTDAGSGAYGVS